MRTTLPTIPEYMQKHVDPNIDLITRPNIPCPFHHEEHGQSFTYSPVRQRFRCWGKCHTGGDVIALHKLHMHLRSYDEAKVSLYTLYGVKPDTPTFIREEVKVNQADIDYRIAYARALRVATTPEDYIELDYVMSLYPPDTEMLMAFYNVRCNNESET